MPAVSLRDGRWVRPLVTVLAGVAAGAVVGLGVAAASSPLYAVAGLVGAVAAVAVVSRTQTGLLAFVALAILLPFGVIPIPLGLVKLTFIDAVITALLIMWVLRLMARPGERLYTSPIDGLVVLFILLALVSFVLGTGYSAETVRLFLKIINSILFFFTVINCVRTRRHLRELAAGLVIAGTATAIIGIVLWALPQPTTIRLLSALRPLSYPSGVDVLRFVADTETLRATSTSVDPNVLGSALMLCLAVTAGQLLSSRPALPKVWLAAMGGVMLVCFFLTLSRSSWIGLAAAMALLGTIKYRRLWILFALVAAALYFGTIPFAEQYISHLQSGLEFQDQAAAMRLGEYKDAVRLISQYPWFGVGFGEAPSVDLYIGASSIYLEMAEEMGLVGAGLFVITMAVLLWHTLRGLFQVTDSELQGYLAGWTGGILAALVAGTADHHFFNLRFPHTVALFWLIAALALVTIRIYRQESE
ncbi:MAG: O-antigen ligase family protein [Bacteroidetes bacterium]|nr:O-antigen ligase family protein [Bacteroidota bacterium]MCL5025578.1 O-antigen ligase family protein [Chloroflexota bacterium]